MLKENLPCVTKEDLEKESSGLGLNNVELDRLLKFYGLLVESLDMLSPTFDLALYEARTRFNRLVRFKYRAKITFRGCFPIDMLRYDQCFPLQGTDAAAITDSQNSFLRGSSLEDRQIIVMKFSERKAVWCKDRWKSFGCLLEETNEI